MSTTIQNIEKDHSELAPFSRNSNESFTPFSLLPADCISPRKHQTVSPNKKIMHKHINRPLKNEQPNVIIFTKAREENIKKSSERRYDKNVKRERKAVKLRYYNKDLYV